MEQHRFHIFYALKQFQKRWLLLVLPLVNALLRFDLPGLAASLYAEAVVLVLLTIASLLVWNNARWSLSGQQLTVQTGILRQHQVRLQLCQLACVEVYRKPLQRLAGAAKINLYCTDRKDVTSLYLTKRDAHLLAASLLPRPRGKVYRPTGGDKIGLAAVSCNLFAGIGLAAVGYSQTRNVLDQLTMIDREGLEQAAQSQVALAAQAAALWLPAGLAWLLVLVSLWVLYSLLVSFQRTARFSVCGDGQTICTRSGLVTRVTRTIRLSSVTMVDLQRTPMARLTRCFPVYCKAGGFGQEDVPCFLYRPGREAQLEALLPGWPLLAQAAPVSLKKRSVPAFLVPPGLCAGVGLVLYLVSGWKLPQTQWAFALQMAVGFVWLAFQLEAYFTEGITHLPGGHTLLCYTAGIVQHRALAVTPWQGRYFMQNPYSLPYGRGTLRLCLPAGLRLRVRSIPFTDVEHG